MLGKWKFTHFIHNLYQEGTMKNFQNKIAEVYDLKFKELGPVPEASLWYSGNRQTLRFRVITEQFLKYNAEQLLRIGDIGCGYGAYFTFLSSLYPNKFKYYYGFDISSNLINYCQEKHLSDRASFFLSSKPHIPMDFTVMSGTYNFFPSSSFSDWLDYFLTSLNEIWNKTEIAMGFNLQIAAKRKITNQGIVYFSDDEIVSYCEKYFGVTTFIYNKSLPSDGTFLVWKT